MTRPKLTPAQQRVFDWLGESPEHSINRHNNFRSRARPYIWTQSLRCPHPCGPKTCEALLPHLAIAPGSMFVLTRYIHPKFAGGNHD